MSSKGRSSIFTTFICVNLNFIVIAIDHLKDLTYRYNIHILEYSYYSFGLKKIGLQMFSKVEIGKIFIAYG